MQALGNPKPLCCPQKGDRNQQKDGFKRFLCKKIPTLCLSAKQQERTKKSEIESNSQIAEVEIPFG